MSASTPRDVDEPASGAPAFSPTERFYRGTIVRVHYGRGTGIVRTGRGRELRFSLPFVEFLDGRRIHELTEGMEVGFDVGWTSGGLKVTKIKVY